MRSILFCFVRCMALMTLALTGWSATATSEPQRIYRCGNAYTNQPDPAANCKPLTGGSVTVIEGTRVQGAQAASPAANASGGAGAAKVDGSEQRQRDAQAQVVLQAELQRAQQQQAELLREWNNGEPERRADCTALAALMQAVVGEPPVMWGAAIVGFGAYRYQYASGTQGDWPLVAFSPRKGDLSVYLMPGFETLAPQLHNTAHQRIKALLCVLCIQRLHVVDVATHNIDSAA